jgi:uroporphyrin-III C-methyltransferase
LGGHNNHDRKAGKVFLVGAGPGDAGLITVKGKKLIEEADVVIYDRLVGEGVLDYATPGAELICVGKAKSFHTVDQEGINRLMDERAREGKRVVRLKGGDPFIFGRGAEEARHLASTGISFEVVPGVTAASGASAYAGIPLTDRALSPAVTLVAGHRMEGRGLDDLNWPELSRLDHTLVFYMALTNMDAIAAKLITNGKDPQTPSAVVKSATTPVQATVVGALADIAGLARESGLEPPVVLIIGAVVGLRGALGWFEGKSAQSS